MLSPGLVTVLALLLTVGGRPAEADEHDPPPVVVESGDGFGIDTTVVEPGSPGTATVAVLPVISGPRISCRYIPDTSNHSSGTPQWELDAPHSGEEGAWFFRRCRDGSFTVVWIPADAGSPNAPRVSPGELAVQAANYLPLPAPAVHHNPDQADGRPQTVVGVPTWLWVAEGSFSTLRQTTSAGGVSATVTASPVKTICTTGSEHAPGLVCPGPGVPYDPSREPEGQSTYCSTVYSRSSAAQPQTGPLPNDRYFTGTATTVWRVSWTGSGGTQGTLPDLRRTSTFRLAVAEIQAVNQ
ncbi:MAG: hypothetical protein LH630_00505 [Actinomycetia bacterium]|nr:hypothetical protein [Actinomycetes bacterium]